MLLSGCSTLTWLCGCATDLVVVLPASDGHIGGVVMEAFGTKVVLDQPYAEGAVESNNLKPHLSDAGKVQQIFAEALAARPVPPKAYTLYFVNDSDELVPESRPVLDTIFTEISSRKAAEIVASGHTDSVWLGIKNIMIAYHWPGRIRWRSCSPATASRKTLITMAGRGIARVACTDT